MLAGHVLLALVASVAAVPLNINLGAYSPALVVGDGEISLGNGEKASELMSTLASGAANEAAGGEGEAAAGQPEAQPAAAPAEEAQAEGEAARVKRSIDPIGTIENILTKRSPRPEVGHLAAIEDAVQWIKRDLQGFNAALDFARDAQKDTPKVELGTEHAGIGILVNAGVNVPVESAANGQGAAERKVKRSEVVEESEAPKMTLVAITEV